MIKRVSAAIITISLIMSCVLNMNCITLRTVNTVTPIRISVLQYREDDDFIADIRDNLIKIQQENEEKVKFTFYDSKNSQDLQNNYIDEIINEGTDLFFVNLVDIEAANIVVNKIKENNLPVILYNREPLSMVPLKAYNKALYIGNDSKEGGIIQGQIIVDLWSNTKETIDKNKDDILQYVLLSGGIDNREARERTKYSVKTIEDAGIKTKELGFQVSNFDKELAKLATKVFLAKHGNNIEMIIANDDSMAAGAVEALQELNYNKGDLNRTIPVIGFDATDEARELISKGFMTGTVIQNTSPWADALYNIGMNLVQRKNPLENTTYQFDETGVAIRIPYEGVLFNPNLNLN